jgi:hypothetical protein
LVSDVRRYVSITKFLVSVLKTLLVFTHWREDCLYNAGRTLVQRIDGKAALVTDHGGPYSFERSRLSHFLDNWLTDVGEVSLKRRPPFAPQDDSWYSFLLEAASTPGPQCGWNEYINRKIQ